jgi:hypothetical protein
MIDGIGEYAVLILAACCGIRTLAWILKYEEVANNADYIRVTTG